VLRFCNTKPALAISFFIFVCSVGVNQSIDAVPSYICLANGDNLFDQDKLEVVFLLVNCSATASKPACTVGNLT
jgi:hypothetical protein